MRRRALGLHLSGGSGARARRAAVLGRPVAHSLSPRLHNAAYAALGLDGWTYTALDCGEDELPALLAGCGPEWAGFSVTMPLKRCALELASSVSRSAAAVGAANTLLPLGDGGWRADNTDVIGIRTALGSAGRGGDAVTGPVVILGAGGTAQAAIVALAGLGLTEVSVLVRAVSRTGEVRSTADRNGVTPTVLELGSRGADAALRSAALVLATLPAHAADSLADRTWPARPVLLDAVYVPWPTLLARSVQEGGGVAVGGTEILLHQAAAQVTLMTGRDAPVDEMRSALSVSG